MKKFISILLLCSLACGLFIACSSGKTESTTTPKVTTTAPSRPNDDLIDVKDDVVIVERKTLTYKYQAVEVTWTDNSYYTRDTDGFSQFVADNANWFAKDFDDSSWTTWASETDGYIGDRLDNLGEGRAASDWNGDNHGLFARTSFNLDQQYLDEIKNGEATLYFDIFYDNTLHLYLNGTEIIVHDESEKFQPGVAGNGPSGCHDWVDEYAMLFCDETDPYYIYEGNLGDLLVAGENVIAVSLLDCWGGRELDIGVVVAYN